MQRVEKIVRAYRLEKGDTFMTEGECYKMITDTKVEYTGHRLLEIYTDGSALKNKEGGWGYAIFCNGNLFHFESSRVKETTNNRMELTAILKALEYIKFYNLNNVVIYSDSAYCVNALNNWIFKWELCDWHKSDGNRIENEDLFKELWEYVSKDFFTRHIRLVKVKGHNGIFGNELVDALATNNKVKLKRLLAEVVELDI